MKKQTAKRILKSSIDELHGIIDCKIDDLMRLNTDLEISDMVDVRAVIFAILKTELQQYNLEKTACSHSLKKQFKKTKQQALSLLQIL